MKTKFASQFQDRQRVYEPVGSRVKQLYSPIYDDRGVLHLTESGKHDLYAEIQSHRDSVDIHVLLARYQNGDDSALQRIQGAYGDFTQMPTTFAEALNTLIAAEQYFKSLPVDVRSRFGHDFNQFIASMDSPTWASDVGFTPPGPSSGAGSSSPNMTEGEARLSSETKPPIPPQAPVTDGSVSAVASVPS